MAFYNFLIQEQRTKDLLEKRYCKGKLYAFLLFLTAFLNKGTPEKYVYTSAVDNFCKHWSKQEGTHHEFDA